MDGEPVLRWWRAGGRDAVFALGAVAVLAPMVALYTLATTAPGGRP